MKDTVIITTHERPTPPFSGANHKIHDIIWALQDVYRLEVLVYDPDPGYADSLKEYWTGPSVRTRVVQPGGQWLQVRALLAGTLRTALMRNFQLERYWIEEIRQTATAVALIADGLSGLPIVEYYPVGVIASVHDCMSCYYLAQQRRSRNRREWLLWALRRRGALALERRYLHRASLVHMVTQEDADLLRRVNPGAKTAVVPIVSIGLQIPGVTGQVETNAMPSVLIWGNLGAPPVREGFRALISAPEWAALIGLGDVTVLGRVPVESFQAEFPSAAKQVRYIQKADDLDAFICKFQLVILPDMEGRGQKNRCFDALRLGRCVAGLSEVFRGLPVSDTPYYLSRKTWGDLVQCVLDACRDQTYRETGARARQVLADHLGSESYRNKWMEFVESVPALDTFRLAP